MKLMVCAILAVGMAAIALTARSAETGSTDISVVVISTKVALGVQDDVERIQTIFKDAEAEVKGVQFRPHLVQVGARTRNELFELLESVVVREGSTLFCYCKLHGEYDPEEGHKLFLDGNGPDSVITRTELLDALTGHEARLTILVTDSCIAAPSTSPIPTEVLAEVFPVELFSDLFIFSEGVVNVNSARPPDATNGAGQLAWMDADGALFTRAFADALSKREKEDLATLRQAIDSSKNDRVCWKEFIDHLTVDTDRYFQAFKKSAQQWRATPAGLQVTDATLGKLEAQCKQSPYAFAQLPTKP